MPNRPEYARARSRTKCHEENDFVSKIMEQSNRRNTQPQYIVVTAAYNEADHIGRLISAVVRQTLSPLRWIIVTDGCTDSTVEIVRSRAGGCAFLELAGIAPA